MRILCQWHPGSEVWGVSLLGVYYTRDFWGFTILGFDFEFPRTDNGRLIHGEMK